ARTLPRAPRGTGARPGRGADPRRHFRLRVEDPHPGLGGTARAGAHPGLGPAGTAGRRGARRSVAPPPRRAHSHPHEVRRGDRALSQLAAARIGARRFSVGRTALVLGALGTLLALLFVLGALAGAEPLHLGRALTDPASLDARILFGLRLPRLTLAAIVGIGLASAGAAYQGLLRNPLADPFLLGVSGGAALGGTLALALGATLFSAT